MTPTGVTIGIFLFVILVLLILVLLIEVKREQFMNITREAHQLKAMYYEEYLKLCKYIKEEPVAYDDFTLDMIHNMRTKNVKK